MLENTERMSCRTRKDLAALDRECRYIFPYVLDYGGRKAMGIDAIEWAKRCEALGAGELCVNSIDADGTKDGYELTLTRLICDAVRIPVIASGGAGSPQHMVDAVTEGRASAALIASIVHYGEYTIGQLKQYMADRGVPVRLTW